MEETCSFPQIAHLILAFFLLSKVHLKEQCIILSLPFFAYFDDKGSYHSHLSIRALPTTFKAH